MAAIDSLLGAVERTKAELRKGVATFAVMICGIFFIAAAAGFVVAAAYIYLAREIPDHLAALSVAGGLALIGFFILLVAKKRDQPRRVPARPSPPPDISHQAEEAADRAARAAMAQVRQSPSAALLTALALGVAVGLLRPKDRAR